MAETIVFLCEIDANIRVVFLREGIDNFEEYWKKQKTNDQREKEGDKTKQSLSSDRQS